MSLSGIDDKRKERPLVAHPALSAPRRGGGDQGAHVSVRMQVTRTSERVEHELEARGTSNRPSNP
eukprot:5550050-Prymnesium_polylepis.3